MNEIELLNDTQLTLDAYSSKKDESYKLFETISKIVMAYFLSNDESIYNTINEIFKNRENTFEFAANTDLVKLHNIFNIIDVEKQMGHVPFNTNCKNVSELFNKYTFVRFAIYRIEANMQGAMLNEAVDCLVGSAISPLAAYIISQDCVSFKPARTIKVLAEKYREIGDANNALICERILTGGLA